MDDAEVTRRAIGMSLTAFSQLESVARESGSCDADVVLAYLQVCPFVASSSPAMTAAIKALKGIKSQPTTTNKSSSTNTRSSQKTQHSNNLSQQSTTTTTSTTPEEATRAAMRIAISAYSQLLVQSETMDDYQLLRKYIQQCPFVADAASSVAVKAALEGLAINQNHDKNNGVKPDLSNPKITPTTATTAATTRPDVDPSSKGKDNVTTRKNDKNKAKQTRQNVLVRPLLMLLRVLVLDFPMALLFATYSFLLWVRRVDQLYIQPSMEAVLWTEERAEQEITYYNRVCDARDLTARKADDLIIPTNATIDEAYRHQLLHGFSLFQGVLTDDVMQDLRNYVVARNHKLTEEESIFVIANKHRYSFGLGTEEPCVARAVKQLATHPKLAPTLEKVLGPDPALIEMTAITSSYGAVDQYWHDDVIAPASVMKYGRTFGPSYSIFIQLQNTTREMGATDACPGTHKCPAGDMEGFCEREGFQAVDSKTGFWRAGDALLMNMNSYHRGTAHVDKNAMDRVMLILTFVPKPVSRAESRQMSQGITFSLRWDMWGHTLSDLAQADTRMTQPWATLRALGLYKLRDASWGIDYVSSAIMRMSNEDNGFRSDELETFLERGGFRWLPTFLQGQISEDEHEEGGWHEFLADTVERCIEFLGYVNLSVVTVYTISLAIIAVALPSSFGFRGFGRSVAHSGIMYGMLFLAWEGGKNYVDKSDWAKDIVSGRRYSSAFETELSHTPKLTHLPSTFPHRKDVLIETRYGSRQLHMYNDFTNDHPGSRFFHDLVRTYKSAYSLVHSDLFRDATAAYLVSAVEFVQGRFLLQNGNEWLWLPTDDAVDFARAELAATANPMLSEIRKELRFMQSDYKYGHLRTTAMARASLENLKRLKNQLLRDTPSGKAIFTSPFEFVNVDLRLSLSAVARARKRTKLSRTVTQKVLAEIRKRNRVVNLTSPVKEPRYGAWLKSGDIIEGTEFLEDGDAHWYKGTLHKVTASGDFYAIYDDGSYGVVGAHLIRAYKPYYIGEELEVLTSDENDDEVVEICTIVTENGDGTFDVFIDEQELLLQSVRTSDLRRPRDDVIEEEREVRNHYAP